VAESRLTVRTLGLATIALGLACVHAAHGDGRGVASFSAGAGGSGSGSARVATFTSSRGSSGRSGIYTVQGDSSTVRSSQVASSNPSGKSGKPTPRRNPAAAKLAAGKAAPVQDAETRCVVKRVTVLADGTRRIQEVARVVPTPAPVLASPVRTVAAANTVGDDTFVWREPTPVTRNAFALPGGASGGAPAANPAHR
jgi:hypothetical protein